MLNVRKTIFRAFDENNKSCVIAEIYVDNANELPEKNGIDGIELVQSSIAYVISTGEIYIFGDDGKWYNSDVQSE